MRLVSATTKHKLFSGLFLLMAFVTAQAQENSPYSRYGLGDIVPNQSIDARGMGGLSAAYVDYDKRYDLKDIYPKSQTVNFLNPASYSKLRITSFNLGFEVDNHTIRSTAEQRKFTVSNAIVSYVQLGIPLNRKRQLGLNFGLRPVTRINYKIEKNQRLAFTSGGSDSIQNLFEGSGGSYEVFAGLGKGFKNFSIGVNVGYFFGTKDYSTRKNFINDTVVYYKSNYETKTSFGGVLVNAGLQYAIDFKNSDPKKTPIRLVIGVYGNLRQPFNASQDIIRETFNYDANGATFRVDSVDIKNDIKGKVEYPSNMGAGFTLEKIDKWLVGADFTTANWNQYKFYGAKDTATQNSWNLHIGGQITPNPYNLTSYWAHVTYRAGFNIGQDYIKADGKNLPLMGITAGAGFPIRKNPYTNQYTYINLALEYGRRGNNSNVLTENLFRVSLGFTLSDLWFIKKKYD